MLQHHRFKDFLLLLELRIFGVAFVRALMPCIILWLNADRGQGVKSCSAAAKHFPQAGQVSPED